MRLNEGQNGNDWKTMKLKEEYIGAFTEKFLIQVDKREVGKSQVRTILMLMGWGIWRSYSPIEDFFLSFLFRIW